MKYRMIVLIVACIVLTTFSCEKEELYTLSLTALPTNGGSISKSPAQNQYESGTSATLTASLASGYQFTRWEGDLTGSVNPATVSVNGNKNITAVFTEVVKQYTVTAVVSPSNGGSVTKSPDQDQYDEGTIANLTANPASDYQFTRWEGDVTGTSNPKTVAMNGNKNVTAIFSEVESLPSNYPQQI